MLILRNIQKGRYPDASYNPYQVILLYNFYFIFETIGYSNFDNLGIS